MLVALAGLTFINALNRGSTQVYRLTWKRGTMTDLSWITKQPTGETTKTLTAHRTHLCEYRSAAQNYFAERKHG